MSSWVQLLLVLLAACLRFGVAEGDPLPAALVELVRNSPISSIEDLHLLLLSDSVDEEDGTSAANGGHRLPRSLDAQPAQQALCKVRTEVVEITRAMLDRSNANFMLWPPCVEVQRCSGCCNTKALQCVPVVTHTRYLQVMKIEYVNKRPTYAKAVVSVVDHVECRCQPAPRPPVPKKKSSRRQHSHQHRNQTLSHEHGQGQVKMHAKDELHQWDELKHNQRTHLEDLLDQHWSPRGDTFTQPEEGYSVAGEDTSRSGEAIHFAPHWAHNSSRLHGTEDQSENVEEDGRISDGNKSASAVDDVGDEVKNKLVEDGTGLLLNITEGKIDEGNGGRDKVTQTRRPLLQEDKSKFTKSHTSGISGPVTQNPQAKFSPTEETISETVGSRARPTKEPNPDPQEQAKRRENETPEEERILQNEAKLEEERKELLLLHKRLDQEKEILRQQQMKREEEERQKEKGTDLHGKHHHLQTTTQKPETTTSTTTTRQPSAPAGPRPPARPNHTKRRMRKNRKRISKAAMRAMLM